MGEGVVVRHTNNSWRHAGVMDGTAWEKQARWDLMCNTRASFDRRVEIRCEAAIALLLLLAAAAPAAE
jgi:hypothetical protein